jgi:glycosyltransferase involved in cell wall biosynthesis
MAGKGLRCVFIGPSSERHKGGVAQFSSRLAHELAAHGETLFISWSEIYPSFLISRTLKDSESAHTTKTMPAQFLLSCINPLTWQRCLEQICQYQPQLVIFTWIHPVHAPVYLFLARKLKRKINAEIVFICHNILPHELLPGLRHLTKLCLSQADRLVVHSSTLAEQARLLVEKKIKITPLFLPLHDFFTTNNEPPEAWTSNRALNMLFFGLIREYKGVDVLLQAVALVRSEFPMIHLTIAGEVFYDNSLVCRLWRRSKKGLPQLVRKLALEKNVALDLRYIPDSEVAGFFEKADLVVFPFRSVSQSGSLTVAYSFAKPVIASAMDGFFDVVAEGKSGYLAAPGDPRALADAILRFIAQPLSPIHVREAAQALSWERYVSALLTS